MWIEADVVDDPAHDEKSFNLGIEIEITEEQCNAFNEKMKGKAFLLWKVTGGGFSAFLGPGIPYLLLMAHWEEEDPSENLSPFTERSGAEEYLTELWTFCGGHGRPTIQCKEVGPIPAENPDAIKFAARVLKRDRKN